MKVKSLKKCSQPSLSLKWEAGEVKELPIAEALSILANPNFVRVDDEYLNRQMTTKRGGRRLENNKENGIEEDTK